MTLCLKTGWKSIMYVKGKKKNKNNRTPVFLFMPHTLYRAVWVQVSVVYGQQMQENKNER